ncbi:hypothetical protein BH10ACT11_BH10ACT11_05600 [soil metagenome]
MISVVMPSSGRDSAVLRTLESLRGQRPPEDEFEVVVIDTGMDDETSAAVPRSSQGAFPLQIGRASGGPAAGRNLGARLARGSVLLFLDDDKAPVSNDLIARHAELHRVRPEAEYGVLGASTWTPDRPVSPLMRWLEGEGGGQFAFSKIEPGLVPAGTYFYTANASLKKEMLDRVGGFNERFTQAALEDIELGVRLEAAGLELDFRPELRAFHDHPVDLAGSLQRAERVGRAASLFMEIHPKAHHDQIARPSRPKVVAARVSRPLWSSIAKHERPAPLLPAAWRVLHILAYDEGLTSGLSGTPAARTSR